MIIKGKVKIIKNPSDYSKIKSKSIIVAVTTTPDIVIVMHKVLAIVTEIDNKLSHAAIIAREYKKPLIMGVANATKKYLNGQIISIDTISKKIC